MGNMGDALATAATQAELSNFFKDDMQIISAKSYSTIKVDGVTDDSAAISTVLAGLDTPCIFFIPANTLWNYTTITHPDNIIIWDASTYDWVNAAWTAQQKIIMKTDSPGTKNANEFIIMAPYHPALILDVLDASSPTSIGFRRNGSAVWQVTNELYSGKEVFAITNNSVEPDTLAMEIFATNNEFGFNCIPSNSVAYKFKSRCDGTAFYRYIGYATDHDILIQLMGDDSTEWWRQYVYAADKSLSFESQISPAKKFTIYPDGKIKWGYSAKVLMNGTEPSGGTDTWAKGDIWLNASPDAGEAIGKTCVTAGSPGTWTEFGQVGYRTNAGSPSGVLTPNFIGEEMLDTTNTKWYKSTGANNTNWVALN